MKIIHRVSFNRNKGIEQKLNDLGVTLESSGDILATFEAAESDSAWSSIQSVVKEADPLDLVRTEFTEGELEKSYLLMMRPGWISGYPMSDVDFGYRQITYDLADYCSRCGVGLKQKAPFQMRGEPKWGKRHVLMLNWVFDEFFARPEVWKRVFRNYGVQCMPVLRHKTGLPLETVVQLKVDTYATAPLRMGDAPYTTCPTCHRAKFLPHRRGYFHSFVAKQNADIFKTQEYFGSGASAHHEIIVSAGLFREIRQSQLKGVLFAPLEESGNSGETVDTSLDSHASPVA
jgi:hypothetical protein